MDRLKTFIKDELSGWKKWQIFWMIAVLLMWCVFLANTIIMYVKWLKETKEQE